MAGAVGFAGVLVLHANSSPPVFGSTAPVGSTPTTTTVAAPGSTTSTLPLSGALRTVVGASERYGYGVLSVRVTVQGSRITEVSVASLQTAEQYSQSLAQQVIPTLRGEVMAAQSARINAISGATYTSEAYAYSVQSALDRLKVS
jgi:uncharacterized protein with FMN-binding domain